MTSPDDGAEVNAGGPKVVALGGGHGLAATLGAARLYAGQLTAVVSVADDGGSSGRLRQIAGIPAPGDLRRCLVALAAEDSPWATAFEYRFPEEAGDLAGHALGNLIIAALANVTGDFGSALARCAQLVGSVGLVLPATDVPVTLKASVDGGEVVGQVAVSETTKSITRLEVLPPDAPVPAAALDAIATADQVLIGPGSLYTSVLATAAVPGIRAALAARSGGRIYICNLRPQAPETEGFGPEDHLRAVIDHDVQVDVMLVEGPAGPAEMHGVSVRYGPLRAPDGDDHDRSRLAAALAQLT